MTGHVPASAIEGVVLPHEHLRLDLRWGAGIRSDPYRWLDDDNAVIDELTRLRDDRDLALLVELSCLGMGRDAVALTRVALRSKVHVVAATGYFTGPFHPHFARIAPDVESLTEYLLNEISAGLDGTSMRPGVIGEVGCWGDAPSPDEERTLAAAAKASLRSGLPVATSGRNGLALLEVLLDQGLPPSRISVGHQDLNPDRSAHRKIAETGAYLAFRTLGGADPAELVRPVLDLIDAGHADRVLLSTGVSRMGQLRAYDGPGYGHLLGDFLPRLRAAGVDDDMIRLITRDNPLRWLATQR